MSKNLQDKAKAFVPVSIVSIVHDAKGKTMISSNRPMEPLELAFLLSQAVTQIITAAARSNSMIIDPNKAEKPAAVAKPESESSVDASSKLVTAE